jgi:hypothetical protein
MLHPFSRFDYLATRVALILVAVATPALAVGLPAWRWARGRPLEWTADVDPGMAGLTHLPHARSGTALEWTGGLAVTISHASIGVWLYRLLPGVLLSIAVLAVVVLLVRLTRRVQRSEAFVADSVGSLRLLALVIVLGWLCTTLADNLASTAVLSAALPEAPATLTLTAINGAGVAMLLTGLLVGVIAEAFAQGARLADDVEGLV